MNREALHSGAATAVHAVAVAPRPVDAGGPCHALKDRRHWVLAMRIQWTRDLATGVPEIDEQHKELFAAVESLVSAMDDGRGREAVATTLQFLERYAVYHFSTEERLMADTEYPGLADHRAAHDDFLHELAGWKQRHDSGDPFASEWLPLDLQFRLALWLREHIAQVDAAFGAFLAARARVGVSGPAQAARRPSS
jgi:hemerythrin